MSAYPLSADVEERAEMSAPAVSRSNSKLFVQIFYRWPTQKGLLSPTPQRACGDSRSLSAARC